MIGQIILKDSQQMNNNYSYQDRNKVVNVGEVLFEEYCTKKGYFFSRLGFDEKKNSLPNFWVLNSFIRNLPDYYIVNKDKSALIMVKGTASLKDKEITLLPELVKYYSSIQCPLLYSFCFKGQDPIFKTWQEVLSLYETGTPGQWHDGVSYRRLDLNV
jgi:hypothetical protein